MASFLHFRRRKKTPDPLQDGLDLSSSECIDLVRPRNLHVSWPRNSNSGAGLGEEECARDRPRPSRSDRGPGETASSGVRSSERRLLESARSHLHPSPPSSDRAPSPQSSLTSNTQHDEPIMPVFDGFPGSTGYDDVRPIESSTPSVYPRHAIPHPHPHTILSPAMSSWTPSPTSTHRNHASPASQVGSFVSPIERTSAMDVLAAARLSSPLLVESYGPNPVTPNPKPPAPARTMSCDDRKSVNISTTYATELLPLPPLPEPSPLASPNSCPCLPQQHLPAQHHQQQMNTQIPPQSYAPKTAAASVLSQTPSIFPRKASAPSLITSYGPNRVTPTPTMRPSISSDEISAPSAVTPSASTPLREDSHFQLARDLPYSTPFTLPPTPPAQQHYIAPSPLQPSYLPPDRSQAWAGDEQDSLMRSLGGLDVSDTYLPNGPLPPYATTDDFKAMEKGAIRQLAPPQAQAELPPTKDGFYYYAANVIEYELPAAAPPRQPPLPSGPYASQAAMHQHQKRQYGTLDGALGIGKTGSSGSASASANGGMSETGGLDLAAPAVRSRAIDEQKFLLSDLLADPEIARLLAKAKARRAQGGGNEGPVLFSPVNSKPMRSFLDDKFDLDGMPRMEDLRV